MRRTVHILLTTVLAFGLALGVRSVSVAAETTRVVSSVDPRGDVRLYGGARLSRGEKRSIDLRRVTVERVGDRARIRIKVRKVIRTPRFDQMFFVTLKERADAPGGQWITQAGFTTKARLSYSYYASVDGAKYRNCGLDVRVRPFKRLVTATIPWRCTAKGPVKIVVHAYTGTFRSDERAYSFDKHRIPERHLIEPF